MHYALQKPLKAINSCDFGNLLVREIEKFASHATTPIPVIAILHKNRLTHDQLLI